MPKKNYLICEKCQSKNLKIIEERKVVTTYYMGRYKKEWHEYPFPVYKSDIICNDCGHFKRIRKSAFK